MQHSEKARELAVSMVQVGTQLGIQVTAQLTQMDHPLGNWLGNSHEIYESIQCLKGIGPEDTCLLYTSPSPRDATLSRMPSSA